jgi:hypothetical protein
VIVAEVWTVALGAVYVIETWPLEFVVPLAADRLPDVALQLTVLLAIGLFELSFSVAVRVVGPPLWRVKVDGVIERVVAEGVAAPDTVGPE